jgi:Txe/YoeB family toxin of Txe-Axe toxin-antitoxin module
MYNILFTRQAYKDAQKIEKAGLKLKAAALLKILRDNPFQNPPSYEKLKGYDNTYVDTL